MVNDLKTSHSTVAVKDDRVIVRSNAASGTAPKLQAFDAADPFGLVARKARGEKVVLPKATIEEIEQPPAPSMRTKIQTAIDYLKENGKTDTHTLRSVLGIKGKSAHPLSYLQDALSDRRIARSGNSWWVPGYEQVKFPPVDPEIPSFVPQATPVVAENPPIVAESRPSATEIMPPVADVKPEVQTTILDNDDHGHLNMPRQLVTEARKLLEQERKASEFACALWSDGELQLVRSGNTVATLTADEARHLSKYLKRTALEVA